MQQIVADALVDALLAGPAQTSSARERCAHVLGTDYPWLGPLVAQLLKQFGAAWHEGSRDAMGRAVADHPAVVEGSVAPARPRVRVPSLVSSTMAPMPANLLSCVVPNLPTAGDIAAWLDITPHDLDWLCRRWKGSTSHYVCSWLPKRTGGARLIESPKPRLRAAQIRILRGLLDYVPPHEAVHGFRRGHSPLSNARCHVGKRTVLRMDLRNFFASVGGGRVRATFRRLGYPGAAANVLTALSTHAIRPGAPSPSSPDSWHELRTYARPHLPQGAPTSPALSNLCAFNFDVRLHHAAAAIGADYTRYADDLAFSGDREFNLAVERFVSLVAVIAWDEGFSVNFRKTKVMRSGRQQRVTGVVVNRTPNLPRADYDRLKATLTNCVRHGPAAQNRDGHADFRAHLVGKVAYARALNPARGIRLARLLDQIDWSV